MINKANLIFIIFFLCNTSSCGPRRSNDNDDYIHYYSLENNINDKNLFLQSKKQGYDGIIDFANIQNIKVDDITKLSKSQAKSLLDKLNKNNALKNKINESVLNELYKKALSKPYHPKLESLKPKNFKLKKDAKKIDLFPKNLTIPEFKNFLKNIKKNYEIKKLTKSQVKNFINKLPVNDGFNPNGRMQILQNIVDASNEIGVGKVNNSDKPTKLTHELLKLGSRTSVGLSFLQKAIDLGIINPSSKFTYINENNKTRTTTPLLFMFYEYFKFRNHKSISEMVLPSILSLVMNNKIQVEEKKEKKYIDVYFKVIGTRINGLYGDITDISDIFEMNLNDNDDKLTDFENTEISQNDIDILNFDKFKPGETLDIYKDELKSLMKNKDNNLPPMSSGLFTVIFYSENDVYKNNDTMLSEKEFYKHKLKLIKFILKNCAKNNAIPNFFDNLEYAIKDIFSYLEDYNKILSNPDYLEYLKELITILCTSKFINIKMKEIFKKSISKKLQTLQNNIKNYYRDLKGLQKFISSNVAVK